MMVSMVVGRWMGRVDVVVMFLVVVSDIIVGNNTSHLDDEDGVVDRIV